ncbi:hypothetical protein BWP39_03180 [Paraburkholderia acidicola]|uniref:Uncharacterized protein n=1 Tax=Paraburkholderia acidicola TaxID=1912599 RepID=A0A2A4F4D8_9BURK|nr:hypothetical protein [Paraburkholderia acidicola]PCE27520.1 hypothetical protein BWP39_03180 [Paraburkholderia acidicola]
MSDIEYSRQLQEKFELYLLALTFTILGLAIQTAKFGTTHLSDLLEVCGWFALLASGLTGLSRLEWLPVTYKTASQLSDLKSEHGQFMEAAEQGYQALPASDQATPLDIHELIADRANAIQKVDVRVKQLERSILRKYSVHKWSFVLGLALLIGARGFPPVAAVSGNDARSETMAHTMLACDVNVSEYNAGFGSPPVTKHRSARMELDMLHDLLTTSAPYYMASDLHMRIETTAQAYTAKAALDKVVNGKNIRQILITIDRLSGDSIGLYTLSDGGTYVAFQGMCAAARPQF